MQTLCGLEILPGFAFKKKSHEEDFDLFLHSVELVLVNNGEKIDVEESETSLEETYSVRPGWPGPAG